MSLILLAVLALGVALGFKLGVWWTLHPARKAANAVRNTAQGSMNGVRDLYNKAKAKITGDKPKDDKEKK